MSQKYITNCCIAATTLLIPTIGQSIECATSKCYIDVYNSVTPTDFPVITRVNEIHKKLTLTIGSQQAKRSKLFVIESDGYPWAVALNDNSIVVTKGAIKRMYREDDLTLGDARVAFILGHELSHLGTEDLFHHKAFVTNEQRKDIQPSWLQSRPEEELRADLRGYTFASIAGYRTDLLVGGDNDFFRNWLSPVASTNSKTHPDNETRRQYLNHGFQKILKEVPYYWFSVAMAHFGQYKDALYLLEDHLNLVETQEAYANLGYVHIQLAREQMPVELAYRYWIPTLLEPNSALELKRKRSLFDREIPPKAMHHLSLAEQNLKHAVNMDETNLTSYINLAAVYLYMPDKLHRAYAAIEDARQTPLGSKDNVRNQLESIYQLIRINDDLDNGDRWPKARDTLQAIANKPSAPSNLLYNFARMLDNRGRDDTAKQYWQLLHTRLNTLPLAYQEQVCFRLNLECDTKQEDSPWVRKDLPLDKDIRYPEVKKYLTDNWNANPTPEKTLPGLQAQVFSNDDGDSLLALDNNIEMMIIRNVPPKYRDLADLIQHFGEPQIFIPVASGQLLGFGSGWSALVRNKKIAEIWVANLGSTSE